MDYLSAAIAFYEKQTPYKVHSIQERSGTGNAVFSVNWNSILRLKKKNPTDDIFFSPHKENFLLSSLCKQSRIVVPPLFFYDPKSGNKIEAQVPLERIQGFYLAGKISHERIWAVVDLLKELHALKLKPDFAPFQFSARLDSYLSRSFGPLDKEIEKKLMVLADQIDASYPPVCVHRDLHEGNILFANGVKDPVYITDFEFAGSGSSMSDIASFIEENNLDAYEDEILNLYYGPIIDPKRKDELFVLKLAYDALWHEWAKCRYLDTQDKVFLEIAENKKKRFHASLPKLYASPFYKK